MAETPMDEGERTEEQAPAVVSSEMVEETAEAALGFLEGERVGEAVRALLTLHPADQAAVALDAPGEARDALIKAMDAAAVAPVLDELALEELAPKGATKRTRPTLRTRAERPKRATMR